MPKLIWEKKLQVAVKRQQSFGWSVREKHGKVLVQRYYPDTNKKTTVSLPIAWEPNQALSVLNALRNINDCMQKSGCSLKEAVEILYKDIIVKLWFFPTKLKLKLISKDEKKWSASFPKSRRDEYRYSRCYARLALANLFNTHPLSVPLLAQPGKPPTLENGFGFVSISHCKDALLVGWSNSKIGVDIESINRNVDVNRLSNYLLSNEEKLFIKGSSKKLKLKNFLSIWVRKEALIKYSKGNIIRDFKSWKINQKLDTASYLESSQCPSIKCIKYKSWLIGVASDSRSELMPDIKTILNN